MNLTPVDRLDDVWLKRDDQYDYGGVAGGKVRTAVALAGVPQPTSWTISAAWAAKPLQCNVEGITRQGGCAGACCTSPSLWPPSSNPDGGPCVHLTPTGCGFDMADRPVQCLLYPLVVNKKAKLVVHGKAPLTCCEPNWGHGPPIVTALHDNLAALFGADEADRIEADVLAGVDPTVVLPDDVARALAQEGTWQEANAIPQARTDTPGGPQGLITAGAAHSPQVSIIAHVGQALGLPVRVHVPARKDRTPEVADAAAAGADVVEHRPGHNSVVVARARADADANPGWVHIPFGMECQEAVDLTAAQVANLPDDMGRLVVPVGSGMTLAGILWGLRDADHPVLQTGLGAVLGVVVGADPTDRLDRWAPDDWRDHVALVDSGTPYDRPADQTLWWGVELDAHYEAKAAELVQPGDCLWVVGIRASQQQTAPMADSDGVVWDGPEDLRQLLTPVGDLDYHPRNVRQGDVGAIATSLGAHGQYRAIATNRPTMQVLTGNHTLQAAQSLGWTHIATTWLDVDDDEALRIVLVDNQLSDIATNDQVALSEVLAELAASPRGLIGTGFDGTDLDNLLADLRHDPYGKAGAALGTLRERFVVPPFSVLDGRQGYWRQRKAAWLETGIKGQEGRAQLERSTVDESGLIDRGKATTGGSVFDPVLCEVAYRWYCKDGGTVLDPFAGGTTRGAVAAMLGYHYTGVELRPEQVDANRAQWADMEGHATGSLQWVVGDSAQLPTRKPPASKRPTAPTMQGQVWEGRPYDMLFTSPPYFNLEPYSTDQLDGSHQPTWPEFVTWYRDLLQRACKLLAPNRFAVLVVGEIRADDGTYYNLVGTTVEAMARAGLWYFNEAAYITPIGSLPVRTAAQFPTSRKLGKGHQNLLVFYNGDPQAIRTDWPELGTAAYAQPQEDPIG